MRFTVCHLIWFIVLAAIACWWWLPTGNDAKLLAPCFVLEEQVLRCETEEAVIKAIRDADTINQLNLKSFDFSRRDIVITSVTNFHDGDWATPRVTSRGWGTLIFICYDDDEEMPYMGVAVSSSKRARAFPIYDQNLNWIDRSVAVTLIVLAIVGLLAGWIKQRIVAFARSGITLRQLLWFVFLAAIGCLWLTPQFDWAQQFTETISIAGRQPDWVDFQKIRSMDDMPKNSFDFLEHAQVDFAKHDIVRLRHRVSGGRYKDPDTRRRLRGWLVFAVPATTRDQGEYTGDGYTLFAVRKGAAVLVMSRTQANLFECGVALGLLALAVSSFYVGRRRRPVGLAAE